jgi:hypothetical protein
MSTETSVSARDLLVQELQDIHDNISGIITLVEEGVIELACADPGEVLESFGENLKCFKAYNRSFADLLTRLSAVKDRAAAERSAAGLRQAIAHAGALKAAAETPR